MDSEPAKVAQVTDCLGSYILGPTRSWVLDSEIIAFKEAHERYHKQRGNSCPTGWKARIEVDESRMFPAFP